MKQPDRILQIYKSNMAPSLTWTEITSVTIPFSTDDVTKQLILLGSFVLGGIMRSRRKIARFLSSSFPLEWNQ